MLDAAKSNESFQNKVTLWFADFMLSPITSATTARRRHSWGNIIDVYANSNSILSSIDWNWNHTHLIPVSALCPMMTQFVSTAITTTNKQNGVLRVGDLDALDISSKLMKRADPSTNLLPDNVSERFRLDFHFAQAAAHSRLWRLRASLIVDALLLTNTNTGNRGTSSIQSKSTYPRDSRPQPAAQQRSDNLYNMGPKNESGEWKDVSCARPPNILYFLCSSQFLW